MVKTKYIGIFSLISLILTVLWLVFLIAGNVVAGPFETFEQTLAYAGSETILFYVTYTNAALVTLGVVMLFSAFHQYFRPTSPILSEIGIVFVPVYAAMNLVAYLSQITVVPRLIDLQWREGIESGSYLLLKLLVQQWPESIIFLINNLAYAILGIPSIIFGLLLFKTGPVSRSGGILLSLNGIACIAGFVGVVIQCIWLSQGVLVGGVLFLLALIPISWKFIKYK